MGIFDNLFKNKRETQKQEEPQFVQLLKREQITDLDTAMLLLALYIEKQTCPTQFDQSEFMATFAEDFPIWNKRVFADKISITMKKIDRAGLIQACYQYVKDLPFERRKSALLSPCFYNCQTKYQSGLKHIRSCVDSYCESAFKPSELDEYNHFLAEKNREVMQAVHNALKQHNPEFVDYQKAKAYFRIDNDIEGRNADKYLLRENHDGVIEGVKLKVSTIIKVALQHSMLDYWKAEPDDVWSTAEYNTLVDEKRTNIEHPNGSKKPRSPAIKTGSGIVKAEKRNQDQKMSLLNVKEQLQVEERSISAGAYHALAITEQGRVVSVGSSPRGRGSGIENWQNIMAVCAGGMDDDGNSFSVGLDRDGKVHVVSDQTVNYDSVSGWQDVVAISAGCRFIIGLKKNGTVYAAGDNSEKQCYVKSWKNIIKIAAGDDYTLGLTSNGTIMFAGNDLYSPSDATKWTDIIDISAALYYVIGLKKDGTAVTTRRVDLIHEPCDVSTWKDLVMVSAGARHVVGLTKNSRVLAAGNNELGQCKTSKWRDVAEISAGKNLFTEFTVGLKEDGTLIAVGNNDFGQISVDSISNIKISAKPTYYAVNKPVDMQSAVSVTENLIDKKEEQFPDPLDEKQISTAETIMEISQDTEPAPDTMTNIKYLPGQEPDKIRERIERLKEKLDTVYPNKNIYRLHNDHKKLGETVTELYKLLGYPNGETFLSTYGYTVTKISGGRPTSDLVAIIDELKRRYPNGSIFSTTKDLISDNPDLASKFSTLGNQSMKTFGMSLGDYLHSQGILQFTSSGQNVLPYEHLKARYTENPFNGTIKELKKINKDINWEDVSQHHQNKNSTITLKRFLIEEGVLAEAEPSVEEKLDAVIFELKNRYSDGTLIPVSLEQLKSENSDLPLSQIDNWTVLVYSEKAYPFLIRNGLISREKTTEEKRNDIVSTLNEKLGRNKHMRGLIEELSPQQQEFVAKFFCQDDY